MIKRTFWLLLLCANLGIACATGWNIPLRVAVIANSLVILMGVAKDAVALYKAHKGHR